MELLRKYFPSVSEQQDEQFSQLLRLYPEWNQRINVISRKDIIHLEERHVLHSLGIAKVAGFIPGTRFMDAGTGGGFPGIPLAILFPDCEFLLVDSIGKKIMVVSEIIKELGLDNAAAVSKRYETLEGSFDFILGRAVTGIPSFFASLKSLVRKKGNNTLRNGFLYLKGGEFSEELSGMKAGWSIYPLSDWFSEEFFGTKKVLHLWER